MPFEWIAAVRFLREGRMQSLLIIVGVGVGVAVIVFMSALLSGLQANLIKRTLSSQAHITLLPPEEIARPQQATDTTALRLQKQAQRLRAIDQWQTLRDRLETWPEIAAVSPVASGPAFAVRGEANKAITVVGIEPERYNRVISLAERLTAGQLRVGAGEAVIGIDLAKDLGAEVGDKLRLSAADGRSDTLTITGLFDLGNKGVNARNVYVGLRTAQSLLDLVGGVSSIDLALHDLDLAEQLARRIAGETGLTADSWIKTNAQFVTALTSQRVSSNVIRFFIALSVAFGIASVLVVSVIQRGKEIGILRAMGATQAQMRRIFLLQGGIVGFFGSLLGSALAWSFLMLWQLLARNPDGTPMFVIGVEPGLVALAAGGASLVGILSALLPARRAAQLDPVVAIRG
ncbi:ABC transporter permease [Dechloromonas agitata]|uniref:ABC transporter permease n=1 Tax=Dechloromonas agitata TaxID=73030 RepID=UPI00237E1C1C|nr:ABC transporter permease [Dechloromonas agitata]MDE1547140.1 ABC transporter permease [Dechloromonas agitata]